MSTSKDTKFLRSSPDPAAVPTADAQPEVARNTGCTAEGASPGVPFSLSPCPHSPAPPAIAKRGLVEIADNLPPGAQVSIAKAFCRIFRTELEARVLVAPK